MGRWVGGSVLCMGRWVAGLVGRCVGGPVGRRSVGAWVARVGGRVGRWVQGLCMVGSVPTSALDAHRAST